MSAQSLLNSINSLDRDIQNQQKKIHDLEVRINSNNKEVTRLVERINREKNINTVINLQKQAQRISNDIGRLGKDKISVSKTLSEKQSRKHNLQQQLNKEEDKNRNKAKDELKEQLGLQEKIAREMERQKSLAISSFNESKFSMELSDALYDVFISHATEDKEDFVEPFAGALINQGLKVWYDEFELKIGDSLRRSIDRGLVNSKYGIVVLSLSFFAKKWTQYELDGLVAREVEGNKVILPIWHRISKNDVLTYSPTLADKKALNTSDFTIDEIAKEIAALFTKE